jgi:ABC-type nitrate/sulfonate/bicarbonate transport system ATPase subunit
LDRAVVFQQHALLPWLSVEDNVRVGIDSRFPEKDKAWRTERARRFVEMVGLGRHAKKKPSEISGGMKQRAGIARAFAVDPEVLLLDEPFGALDALTRGIMQDELIHLWESDRKTVIMITHDVDEAVYLSDRIVLMTNGPKATIHEVLEVPMTRPRDRETMVEDPDYVRVRKELVHYLTANQHREAA